MAELDGKRRQFLLERLDGGAQTLLTTTELEIFDAAFLQRAQRFIASRTGKSSPPR